MSLSSRGVVGGPGRGHGAATAELRADISGHGVSDVSLLLPWGAAEAGDRAWPRAAGLEKGHSSSWCD